MNILLVKKLSVILIFNMLLNITIYIICMYLDNVDSIQVDNVSDDESIIAAASKPYRDTALYASVAVFALIAAGI